MSSQPINYPVGPTLMAFPTRVFSWSGIFAGTFLFLAIEATFATLGMAIFGVPATSNAANIAGRSITVGTGIWMIVLSIIALYFAGKLASKVSGAVTRNIGMYAGLVTFGMSIFASFLITWLTGPVPMVHMLHTGGYWLFVALVLGMISAGSGGIHGAWTTDRNLPADRSSASRRAA